MKLSFILIISFVVAVSNSCSNKIDIIGDYEENAVVYGILDPTQAIQFVKINKVFTNPNNSAAIIAKQPDSLYFDSIAPTLTEVETGRIIPLFKVNILLKDIGYFASSPNYLYATKEKIFVTDPNNRTKYYHYRFDLYLPKTNKHISALTNIPDSLKLSLPNNILSTTNPSISLPLDSNIKLRFNSPVNGKIFDGYFYFNYVEINKLDTNIKTVKTIKWRLLNNFRTYTDNGRELVNLFVGSNSFYDLLLSEIPVDTTLKRKFMTCRVEFYAGNLELDNFIQSSTPSIGIVQKQTEYTNLSNGGIGIFAARRVTTYSGLLFENYGSIITQPPYKKLGFVR